MNILGVDYGTKHVGLAISQDEGMPLGFMTVSETDAIHEIRRVVAENKIDAVIVGLPENAVQSDLQMRTTDEFMKRLAKAIPGVRVDSFDETMTTKMARRYSSKVKEHQESARIILEDWMKKNLA